MSKVLSSIANIEYKINLVFQDYKNRSVASIKKEFAIDSSAKSLNSIIVKRIFSTSDLSKDIKDELKNQTIFKSVTVNSNNRIKEHMSFPIIDFYDMYKNDWQNSEIYNYFSNSTFVIFVFKKTSDDYIFHGFRVIKLDDKELNSIFLVWEKVKNMIINNQIILGGKYGCSVVNFPKKSENSITHLRPHDRNSKEGTILLPDGRRIMKYCFWLNNDFIERKIKQGDNYEE